MLTQEEEILHQWCSLCALETCSGLLLTRLQLPLSYGPDCLFTKPPGNVLVAASAPYWTETGALKVLIIRLETCVPAEWGSACLTCANPYAWSLPMGRG